MWSYNNSVVSEISNNVFLYQLSLIGNVDALIKRIPDNLGGVYVWYRHFDIPPNFVDNPRVFIDFITQELSKSHCMPRDGRIPPAYKIQLSSDVNFPKEDLLKKKAQDSEFRAIFFEILKNSLFFQQPLYIGKTNNFCIRIKQHLLPSSTLKKRLALAGHDIDKSKLLLIGLQNDSYLQYEKYEDSEFLENLMQEDSQNLLIEDMMSRLFFPSFTDKYG